MQEGGPHTGFWDYRNAGDAVSLVYQPLAMRWRGVPVYTNTPTRTAQRGPGYNQIFCAVEPLIDRAARELGIDRLQMRLINDPQNGSKFGPQRQAVSSCFLKDALTKGAARFKWDEKKKLSGQRNGSKVTGVAVARPITRQASLVSTAWCASRPTGSSTFTTASAISARSRIRRPHASPPRS